MLLRSLVCFTLVVALAALGVFWFASRAADSLYSGLPGKDVARWSNLLAAGNYEAFPTKRLLGARGFIAVADAQGTVLYTNSQNALGPYAPETLACISLYQKNTYIAVLPQRQESGEEYMLVTRETFSADGKYTSQAVALLDGHGGLVEGSVPGVPPALTAEQYGYLTQSLPDGYQIWRYPFTAADGRQLTAVLYEARPGAPEYARLDRIWNYGAALIALVYAAALLALVLRLNRRINRPLASLNRGLVALAQQGVGEPILYHGPREFEQICASFNSLSARLQESEKHRRKLESDRQKMLADISHDLKTPITVIQGYSRAVCDGLIPEDRQKQYLETIARKAEGLTELINAFYDYSKLEHPDFSLELARGDLCEFLREYLVEKYSDMECAGFALEVDIPEQPLWCRLDARALTRALDNLTANALKHNPSGTTVFFALEANLETVRITLADNGVGIPAQIAPQIFEPFVVGDDARSTGQGSGLGLAISRRIIAGHGGSIQLILPPQKGYSTQFEILLPRI